MNPATLELAANAGVRRYCMPRHERPGMPALARPDEMAQWHLKLGDRAIHHQQLRASLKHAQKPGPYRAAS